MEQGNKAVVTLSMEELQQNIADLFTQKIKELGLDRPDRKHGIFPAEVLGKEEKEQLELTKKERIRDYIVGVYKKDQAAIAKALTGLTTSGLGFIPREFQAMVIREMEDFGLVRRLALIIPMQSDSMRLNAQNGEITVVWTDAGSAIAETTPTYTEPTLTIKKPAGITAMYRELFEDADVSIVDHLAELYGEAMAGAEDTQGLVGTGSPFHGLIGGTITGQVTVTSDATSYTGFNADDLLDLAHAVSAKYRRGAGYFMHPTVFSYIRRQKDDQGAYIVQRPTDPGQPPTIWGYPVFESEKCPSTDAVNTKFVGFANMRRRLRFGDRRQFTFDISDQATLTTAGNLWETDQVAVKGTERVGLVWTLGAGTAVLKTAAS